MCYEKNAERVYQDHLFACMESKIRGRNASHIWSHIIFFNRFDSPVNSHGRQLSRPDCILKPTRGLILLDSFKGGLGRQESGPRDDIALD